MREVAFNCIASSAQKLLVATKLFIIAVDDFVQRMFIVTELVVSVTPCNKLDKNQILTKTKATLSSRVASRLSVIPAIDFIDLSP